jgi:hypothetical protein
MYENVAPHAQSPLNFPHSDYKTKEAEPSNKLSKVAPKSRNMPMAGVFHIPESGMDNPVRAFAYPLCDGMGSTSTRNNHWGIGAIS